MEGGGKGVYQRNQEIPSELKDENFQIQRVHIKTPGQWMKTYQHQGQWL